MCFDIYVELQSDIESFPTSEGSVGRSLKIENIY